jgi:hypothetical protein
MRLITGGHAEEVQEDPSNPNVALSASIIGASAEAFHREIQELFANFNRGFMTTRTTTTSRPIPVPTTPPAAAKATPAPAPKSNTPKSAVDRLLEDDILDDDSV